MSRLLPKSIILIVKHIHFDYLLDCAFFATKQPFHFKSSIYPFLKGLYTKHFPKLSLLDFHRSLMPRGKAYWSVLTQDCLRNRYSLRHRHAHVGGSLSLVWHKSDLYGGRGRLHVPEHQSRNDCQTPLIHPYRLWPLCSRMERKQRALSITVCSLNSLRVISPP